MTMRSPGHMVALVTLFLALGYGPAALAEGKVLCRWGKKADMAAIPDCGVPREVEVAVPPSAWKFYFTVDGNPGLTGYYHSPKAGGPIRPFKRKINLVNSRLFLCPADFREERILAFELVDRRKRLLGRPTCRLGPPQPSRPRPRPRAAAGRQPQASQQVRPAERSVARPILEKGSPGPWRKVDRLARAMGLAALILSLLSLLGLAVLVRFCQKRLDAAGGRDVSPSGSTAKEAAPQDGEGRNRGNQEAAGEPRAGGREDEAPAS